jgi:hypothetical protein
MTLPWLGFRAWCLVVVVGLGSICGGFRVYVFATQWHRSVAEADLCEVDIRRNVDHRRSSVFNPQVAVRALVEAGESSSSGFRGLKTTAWFTTRGGGICSALWKCNEEFVLLQQLVQCMFYNNQSVLSHSLHCFVFNTFVLFVLQRNFKLL